MTRRGACRASAGSVLLNSDSVLLGSDSTIMNLLFVLFGQTEVTHDVVWYGQSLVRPTRILFVVDPPKLLSADGLVFGPSTLLFRLSHPLPHYPSPLKFLFPKVSLPGFALLAPGSPQPTLRRGSKPPSQPGILAACWWSASIVDRALEHPLKGVPSQG